MPRLIIGLLMVLAASASTQAQSSRFSGSWFDPARSGEGFIVQIQSDSQALVTWFTYPPEGEPGTQAWLIGTGTLTDDILSIDTLQITSGGRFGAAFDPSEVIRTNWGSLQITFTSCQQARVDYQGPGAYGSGSFELTRLTELAGARCQGQVVEQVRTARSGTFFDPSHDGEGWMIELLANQQALLYWFSYDDQGRQRWWTGLGTMAGDALSIDQLVTTTGTRFGADFDASEVQRIPWGSLVIEYQLCDRGQLHYQSGLAPFGRGQLAHQQLLQIGGTDCSAPPVPAALIDGEWAEVASMPLPAVSEMPSAALDGWAYLAGGLSQYSTFRRYHPDTDVWEILPDLPAGRHHSMMAASGRSIYVLGGRQQGDLEGAESNVWRYDLDSEQWQILPSMPMAKAAGAAAILHQTLYVVGGKDSPALLAMSLADGTWRTLPGHDAGGNDHTLAVAFEGELWQIGGRGIRGETTGVQIFDPFSEQWRTGPALNHRRAGHAAAVAGGQLMVAGGEVVQTDLRMEASLEILSTGSDVWRLGPAMPLPLHGNQGAGIGKQLLFLGGSPAANLTFSNGRVFVYTGESDD